MCRLEHIFGVNHTVQLPRQTLARGVELTATWLKPIARQIRQEQLAGGFLLMDEPR